MKTLQEKYNAILEGNFSKTQFVRDARLAHSNLITQFNSFADTVAILKNKGMVVEAKKAEVTAYKKPEVDPIDMVAPDLLDHGIEAELHAAGITGTPSEEEYAKAKEKAAKELIKDPLCYKNAQTMTEPGEKMEKAKLQEGDTQNTFLRDRERLRDELSDKEVAAAVADEPNNVGKAFRDMVMQEPETYVKMSKDELIAAFKDFKENYYIDQEAQERMDAIAGQPDFQEGAEDVNVDDFEANRTNTRDFASSHPKKKDDGTYDIKDIMKEAQLKEAVKALIKKTLES